jgi:hypothetical protein
MPLRLRATALALRAVESVKSVACSLPRSSWYLVDTMRRLSLIFPLVSLFVANLVLSGQRGMTAWSGVIINSGCTADEAFAEADKCFENLPGAKLVLYDDTTRQMFDLEPQTQAAGRLGDAVTVHGTLEGKTIHVSSLQLLTSIGLPAGQKAPAFSARDQFGHQQTLDTLKGSGGTVLLFFRSADW